MSDPHDAGAQSFTAMSLRDYFAAQALQGLLAKTDMAEASAARAAYEVADAMLAERAKDAEART